MGVKQKIFGLASQHPVATGAIAGGAGGSGIGYVSGLPALNRRSIERASAEEALNKGYTKDSPEYQEIKKRIGKRMHIASTVASGLTGAMYGGFAGAAHHDFNQSYRRRASGHAYSNSGRNIHDFHKHVGTTGKETTKAEVKSKYRAQVKKHHPDLTTDPAEKARREAKMKEINNAYSHMEQTPWFQKLSFFWQGFEKQAMVNG